MKRKAIGSWKSISRFYERATLLIGNGFSQNIWPAFGYASLYKKAKKRVSGSAEHDCLWKTDQQLFGKLKSKNFERVLSALATTKDVVRAIRRGGRLRQDAKQLRVRYDRIRRSLFAAVSRVHMPFARFSPIAGEASAALARYQEVYTTNYDLLLYWAVNHEGACDFQDWFLNREFEPADPIFKEPKTKVYFLHGGIHLFKRRDGRTGKIVGKPRSGILQKRREIQWDELSPLFVTEGNSDDKLRSIRNSDYLGFALDRLGRLKGRLVILGHSLSEHDEHIARAISSANLERIAVSVRATGESQGCGSFMRHARKMLDRENVDFFDAATHPLGCPGLSAVVADEEPAPRRNVREL